MSGSASLEHAAPRRNGRRWLSWYSFHICPSWKLLEQHHAEGLSQHLVSIESPLTSAHIPGGSSLSSQSASFIAWFPSPVLPLGINPWNSTVDGMVVFSCQEKVSKKKEQVEFNRRSILREGFGNCVIRGDLTLPTPSLLFCSYFELHLTHLWSESCSVVSDSLWPHELYSPWTSLDQNPGLGSHSLLQGIFPTQGSNPDLPHCRWILYQLSH